jgi:undecaprenyl-diphosphatase
VYHVHGITITTGRLLKVNREAAARFSFMLSTPIVLVAALYHFKDFLEPAYREAFMASNMLMPFLIGILVSFVIGIFIIKFLLDYLKKGSYKAFAIYRVVLGLAIIGYLFIK